MVFLKVECSGDGTGSTRVAGGMETKYKPLYSGMLPLLTEGYAGRSMRNAE
jgi:hypothetical protein